jgi:hypothetical protein
MTHQKGTLYKKPPHYETVIILLVRAHPGPQIHVFVLIQRLEFKPPCASAYRYYATDTIKTQAYCNNNATGAATRSSTDTPAASRSRTSVELTLGASTYKRTA